MSSTSLNPTSQTAVTKDRVLEIVRNGNGLSATAISQAVGYARKNPSVDIIIDQLVADGSILRGTSGGSVIYSPVVAQTAATGNRIPSEGAIRQAEFGYGIERLDNGGAIVVTPEGDTHTLAPGERVVVINEDPTHRYKVDRPEDLHVVIFHAINRYTDDKSIRSYTIRDLSTQQVLGESLQGLNSDPVVIFIRVNPENKAGK